MKLVNLQRATEAHKELISINKAIKESAKFYESDRDMGFLICAHNDCSGPMIDYQYTNGNFHEMYIDIMDYIHNKLNKAKDDLLEEIKGL